MDVETKRSIFVGIVVFGFLYIAMSIITRNPLIILGIYAIASGILMSIIGVVKLSEIIFK